MARPELEVADLLRDYGDAFLEAYGSSTGPEHRRVLNALRLCRTAELGGHIDMCDACGHELISYNSCRNRHCPKCQSLAQGEWLEARHNELLPVPYFHLVFTIPHELSSLALQNKRAIYNILFRSASETLQKIAADSTHLGADIGFFGILHTWSQTLMHHPHIHFVVPGGGLSTDREQWVSSKNGFFLPVRVLAKLFRGIFLHYLLKAFDAGELEFYGSISHMGESKRFKALQKNLYRKKWVVYAKRPFGGPEQVLEYLGRYTHRVAISNHRLVKVEDGNVTFRYRDPDDVRKQKLMTLPAVEFIRRFLLHVLPDGFVKIRYFGILSNRSKKSMVELSRELLGAEDFVPPLPMDWKTRYEKVTGVSVDRCPKCSGGSMQCVRTLVPFRFLTTTIPSRISGIDSS